MPTETLPYWQTVMDQVAEMIGDITGRQGEKARAAISKDTDLLQIDDFDSLDRAELLCMVEDKYPIEIPDHEIAAMKTVGDLVDNICRKVC